MNLIHCFNQWLTARRERRQRRKQFNEQLRTMRALTVVFETLNKFKQAGLLYVDFKRQNVTISNVLASFYIYDDAAWRNFLSNVHRWVVYQYSVNDYVRRYTKMQADAEAKAKAESTLYDEDDKQATRMDAAARFDEESVQSSTIPDLQFIVLGAANGRPIVVARLINGEYVTDAVPDELR